MNTKPIKISVPEGYALFRLFGIDEIIMPVKFYTTNAGGGASHGTTPSSIPIRGTLRFAAGESFRVGGAWAGTQGVENLEVSFAPTPDSHAALVEAARAALSELERLCEETEAQRLGYPDLTLMGQLKAALAAEE
jgi:hypothetical protein